MSSSPTQSNNSDMPPRPTVVARSDALAAVNSPVAGILIATSSGTAGDDSDRGDAEATLSLLQVDDEYDARQLQHRRLQQQQGIYRHYSLHGVMSPSNGGSPNSSSVRSAGGGKASSSSFGRSTGRHYHHTADATASDASELRVTAPSSVPMAQPDETREVLDVAHPSSTRSSAEVVHRRETALGGTGVVSLGGDVAGPGVSSVSNGDDDDSARGDEVPWLLDQEELEAREKLQRALRDQQRFRQEELRDLQRVYVKAMRKTFRSLRGMPEPSFDTPTALYEEELDAMAAAAAAEAGAADCTALHGGADGAQEGDGGAVPLPRDVRYVVGSASAHPLVDSNGALDTTSHHADCNDEDSMVESAQLHFISNVLGGGGQVAARYDAPLPGGTHIHTTHGGGDDQRSGRSREEVYGGSFSTGFVHKLRSRRETQLRDAPSADGRSPSE